MKAILCYGDSNVWGNIPGSFNFDTGLSERYTKDKRWTGILQKELGDKYNVIEEGINARTTNLDEIIPGRPYKNGLTQLPVSLETHYPIDLIIFWLGSNDTKIQYNRSAKEIAEGMRHLINIVRTSNKGRNLQAPKILLVAPHTIVKIPNLHPQLDDNAIEKSKTLAEEYQQLAQKEGCEFFDAAQIVTASKIDGVHLEEADCELLGKAITQKVKQIISN